MVWTLSDGTTVTTDGVKITVVGSTYLARCLAEGAANPDKVSVPIDPQPGSERLAPSRAYNVDAWIEKQIRIQQLGEGIVVSVTSRPYIEPEPPEPPEDDSDLPPGIQRVY